MVAIYRSLCDQKFLETPIGSRVTLARETPMQWPVIHKSTPHKCIGVADYSLFFGDQDHLACHLVVIEAKRRGAFPDQGQILAYMAIVQASRRERGQSDWTVWGTMTDGWHFWFYRLDLEGRWSRMPMDVLRDGWPRIADMIGGIIIRARAASSSSFRLSLSSTNQAPSSTNKGSAAPRISSLQFGETNDFASEIEDAWNMETDS